MDRLWTPWRRAFVESAGVADNSGTAAACFLCDKPAQSEAHDRANLLLHRGELVYALLNLYPYNSGHLMVVPYQHTGDFAGLKGDTAAALTALTQRCVAALQATYSPEAFNIGMNLGRPAGAGVPDHLHMHVVPRWGGDTNFMPIVGDTKVLPESLEQTYDRLVKYFR
jgi:ATP adenylyltransferase